MTAVDYGMYVGGVWTGSGSEARMDAISPVTGEKIGSVPEGTRADVRWAVAEANGAAGQWAALSAFERSAVMTRAAGIARHRREELARTLTLDQGKPLDAESYDEVDELIDYFELAAADAIRLGGAMPPSVDADKRALLYRVPRGVVGVISPWNWPYTMPGELLIPALACGNAVVWAPAPSTSVCAVKLAECVVDAGVPPGVFNMVTGPGEEVGDEVAVHPGTHALGFIGSIETGHKVAARGAGKALLLEMGGNGPVVVLDDADLDAAAEASLDSAFLGAGQSCTAGERFMVHEKVHDAYVERVVEAVKARVRLGDPFESATTLGPLNNEPTAQKIDRHIADAVHRGAQVCLGGARADGYPTRLYYQASVLTGVTAEMEIVQEETFGPVLPIVSISDESEVVRTVNDSSHGLLSAVFTRDLERGLRFAESIRTGWVNINASSNHWESHLPFGGHAGSRSGVGRVGGRHPMEAFTEFKTVIVQLGRRAPSGDSPPV